MYFEWMLKIILLFINLLFFFPCNKLEGQNEAVFLLFYLWLWFTGYSKYLICLTTLLSTWRLLKFVSFLSFNVCRPHTVYSTQSDKSYKTSSVLEGKYTGEGRLSVVIYTGIHTWYLGGACIYYKWHFHTRGVVIFDKRGDMAWKGWGTYIKGQEQRRKSNGSFRGLQQVWNASLVSFLFCL